MSLKLLIVEDQFIEANNLQMILERAGYMVTGIARSVQIALDMIKLSKPDIVLLDIFLRGKLTGIDLAHKLREQHIAFVYLSANSNREVLTAAKATFPYGFLVKPFREKDVLISLEVAEYLHKNQKISGSSRDSEPQPKPNFEASNKTLPEMTGHFAKIVGDSLVMQGMFKHIRLVAPTETSILITGESGTGKEKVADAVHSMSGRRAGPMVKINCSALPKDLVESILFGHVKGAFTGAFERKKGKFEQANGGTLFLDEVGELSMDVQCKLLRALQEREIEPVGGSETINVDVRVIAATNRNLTEEMAAGRFRIDLFYRLNAFPIHVPALRDRGDDIALLSTVFLQIFKNKAGRPSLLITDKALATLKSHDWPGNVRELENVIERSVILNKGNVIDSFDIGALAQNHRPSIKTIDENEREHIRHIVKLCNGKISGESGAAELLGIPVSTLNSKMKRLGIERNHS